MIKKILLSALLFFGCNRFEGSGAFNEKTIIGTWYCGVSYYKEATYGFYLSPLPNSRVLFVDIKDYKALAKKVGVWLSLEYILINEKKGTVTVYELKLKQTNIGEIRIYNEDDEIEMFCSKNVKSFKKSKPKKKPLKDA